MTQREQGEFPRNQNEIQEAPKVRGNETQENPKGPKGSSRVTNGARRASIVPRRIPKGSRPGRHRRVRRVAKGGWISEFDDCYTVS